MSIKQRITDDLKAAMKAGDKARLGVLRMVKSRMLEAEVDLRTAKGRDYQLNDEEATGVLATYAKQRRDSIESYERAGRDDLASTERLELAIIQEYLPERLSEDELRRIVQEAIASTGAMSARDMGSVMKIVMPRVKGAADGKLVSSIAAKLLEGK